LVELCRTPFYAVAARGVAYWKQSADLDAANHDATTLRDFRHLSASVTFNGVVAIDGVLDPLGGATLTTELDRISTQLRLQDQRDGVQRSVTQRRADALVEMAMRSATAPADGLRPRPLLSVTIGIDPFTHLCQTAAGTVIAPDLLIPYLPDADIERIVYDPPARRFEASRKRRFSGAMRRLIEIRDGHCQHPSGCDEPASNCDIDHIIPHSAGGITCLCQGDSGCLYHNRTHKPATDKTTRHHGRPPTDGKHPCPYPHHHKGHELPATGTTNTDHGRAPPDTG
jgi:hypothetical protein